MGTGSSPHTRGTPANRRETAHKGRDHPRIRGEHNYRRCPYSHHKWIIPAYAGNTLARCAAIRLGVGIIPAYAGNTAKKAFDRLRAKGSSPHTRGTPPPSSGGRAACRDHPRIRGEHALHRHVHARGAGIIPAYAGNTSRKRRGFTRPLGSSPHTRGTPIECGPRYHPARGSSPHTRGTLSNGKAKFEVELDHPRIRGEHRQVRRILQRVRGIIPAYAGNTFSISSLTFQVMGSSPHTRGTPSSRSRRARRRGDHPRIRGEHTYLPAIPIPGVAVLYHFIQSDGPCASCLHRSSLTSWLHSSSHLRNRSASPSKPSHRNPWASSRIDEHEMQHAAHYWPNRPLSPCHH